MVNNLVVAISGGAGRIGSAFCRAVVDSGGRVVIGDVNREDGLSLEKELGEENSVYFHGNLIKVELINQMIRVGVERFGSLDAAVHCAYPVSEQWGNRFEDLQSEGLNQDLFNQLGGAILFSQQMIHHFQQQGYGNLIHISSIHGINAPKFEHYENTKMVSPIEYSAIKSGIIAITKYLAKYCKTQNIRVNCISPGGILTNQPDCFLKKYRESCLSKGMLDANDLSGTLIFLLSNQSKYLNGQNIIVDDGWIL